ncbi:MAG: arginine--tRNA ligase [Candidatus Saccharibacteria bacterium]|nr:arginine--tRNA ligase [Candidatus Saccharibacteria bacterium]
MQELREILKKVILESFGIDFEPEITPAPENIDADYSSNVALKLAKDLHKNPMEIAEELSEHFVRRFARSHRYGARSLEAPRWSQCSQNVLITPPGFINFKLSDEILNEKISGLSENFEISSDEFSGKTVVCEFSDPNPFKVLHVGHLYTSVVGDSISRLFEYAGAKVVRANFGGDVGLHVAKTMYILKQKNPAELTIEDIARCYVEGTAVYEDDEGAKAEITELNKEIYKINAENIHGTLISDLYWKGRELSYEYFKDFYARIGVEFDKFYPESTVAGLGLSKVLEELEKGVYEKSEGAVIFDGEKYGLHTRVFINKEGVPTYEAKDVGLIFKKYDDYHFDKSVVITGSEQLEYMKVVLKSVEQYAPELVSKTSHLTHGLVKLPGNVKMSSRKGNFLKAVDVLEMVADELKNEYNSEDTKVSLAATKYAFLKYKMGGDIIFDVKESVKMTGCSGPYLLYSAVRAKKILNNFNNEKNIENYAYNIYERNLIKKILEYKNVLDEAVVEMAPHKLANYLYEVSQEFSRFYENCPVVGSNEEAERVKLVKVYYNVMEHGLNILGIEIPEEM